MSNKRRSGLRSLDPGRRLGFRSIIVEPYLQVKLGMFILLLNFIFAGVIGGVFYYYLMDIYGALNMYFNLAEADSVVTWGKLSTPLIICGSLVFLFMATTLYITVKYTHKIYGPLVSIHKFLDQALAGEKPDPLKLRASDQLNDLAEKINKLYEKSGS